MLKDKYLGFLKHRRHSSSASDIFYILPLQNISPTQFNPIHFDSHQLLNSCCCGSPNTIHKSTDPENAIRKKTEESH